MDEALQLAEDRLREQQLDEYYAPALRAIIDGLYFWRAEAISGALPPSNGSRNLGLSRAVLDWDSQYSALVKTVGKVDKYYQENF
jgi:hypothetical protein